MGHQLSLGQVFKHLSLFEDLGDQDKEHLAQSSWLVRQLKGGYVFKRGDRPKGLYIVITGKIKIAIPGLNDHDKVIEFFEAGQQFGEAVMFLDHPYLIDAQALEDSLLVCIAKEALMEVMSTNTVFMKRMIDGLALRFETLLHDIEVVNLPTAAARVADYLLQHSSQSCEMDLSLPKRTIASKLGLQPETFSRALHQLRDEQCITVCRSKISIINREGLEKHAPQLGFSGESLNASCPTPAQPHKLPPERDWTNPASLKYFECEF